MENLKKIPKMTLAGLKNALSRAEMKKVVGGSGECIARWWACSIVTEDTDCCGTSKCMPYGSSNLEQCV